MWIYSAVEELLPVGVFFIVQQQYGMRFGLVAMLVALAMLMTYTRLRHIPQPRFAIVSTMAFLLFAVPSIVTNDSRYFQISDTILDGMFAVLLLGSYLVRWPLLKILFENIFAISDCAWHTLSLRWGLLFLILAICNEYIRLYYSEDVWSWYKLLSTIGILAFGCYQFTLSARERIVTESNWLGLRK